MKNEIKDMRLTKMMLTNETSMRIIMTIIMTIMMTMMMMMSVRKKSDV